MTAQPQQMRADRHPNGRTRLGLLAVLLATGAMVLSGCSTESEPTVPSAVMPMDDEVPYGQRDVVQENLRQSLTLAQAGFEETGTLELTSDYFNTRSGDISYSVEWPTSLAISRINLVSVHGTPEQLTFASKDVSGVCWYVQLRDTSGEPEVRYGASNDASCIASRAAESAPTWESMDFPLSAPTPAGGPAGTAGAAGGNATPAASTTGSGTGAANPTVSPGSPAPTPTR